MFARAYPSSPLFPSFPPCRGFTPYLREDYLEWKREGRLVNDGVNAKVSSLIERGFALAGLLCPAHLARWLAGWLPLLVL